MSFQKMDLSNRKRPGGRNVIFIYGFSAEAIDVLNQIKIKAGVDELIFIDEQRKSLKITALLADIHDNDSVTYKRQTDQIVLFHGTSQFELQQFIQQLRETFKERPYIAMVTETSKMWVFNDLMAELKDERRALEKSR